MGSSRALSHSIDIPATSQGSSDEESLLSSIEGKLKAVCPSITIFRAPNEISIKDRHLFVPAKVSIGPFHHGAPHLAPMEELKWRYLCAFLKNNPSVTLNHLIEPVVTAESRLRTCYEEKFYDFDGNKFSQMMLLDCCFILELLMRYSKKRLRPPNDFVFTTPGLLFVLRCDLMLLENQIPYFLLKDVYKIVRDPPEVNMSLSDLTSRFFKTMVAGDQKFVYDNFMVDGDHLLEMVYSCFLSTYPRMETNDKSKSIKLPSASELKTAGIKFKNARSPNSLLDIKFQNGVLEIPPLKVYQQTETILRNLAAYEIRQFGSDGQVKSYVNFMSYLLKSGEDVKILCRKKILSDQEDDKMQTIRNLKWTNEQESLSGTYFAGIVQKLNEKPERCVTLWRKLRRNPVAIGVAVVWVVVVIFVAAFFSAFSTLQRRYK